MGQAAAAGFAAGGVVAGKSFIFGEMATGSFLPVEFAHAKRHQWSGEMMEAWVDAVEADPDRHIVSAAFEDADELGDYLRQVVDVDVSGPIRPLVTPPDEAERAAAFPAEAYTYDDDVTPEAVERLRQMAVSTIGAEKWEVVGGFRDAERRGDVDLVD